MNAELQKLRRHYQTLSPHIKERTTARYLLRAIQIAEESEESLKTCHDLCTELRKVEREYHAKLDS